MNNTIYTTGAFNSTIFDFDEDTFHSETFHSETFRPNHTTYGGTIYQGDFDAHHSISDIAARIAASWNFDRQCQRNIANRAGKRN